LFSCPRSANSSFYKKTELQSILPPSTKKQTRFYPMTESTHKTGGPSVVPATLSGLAALKNVDGHGQGGSDIDSKDGDSSTTNYGYGDDSDNEDDFPVYGYGRNTKSGNDYDDNNNNNNKGEDDDDDKGDGYGYGEDKDAGSPADDYGYGNEAAPFQPSLLDIVLPARPRRLRRNSCIIRKDQNPLAVAEYLLGGPPPMSDRDMELHNEGALSA
jgi:hypothetical protein